MRRTGLHHRRWERQRAWQHVGIVAAASAAETPIRVEARRAGEEVIGDESAWEGRDGCVDVVAVVGVGVVVLLV
jgi:hypothetical protein